MKYIIIGLGNYGRVLAEELSALGHEIIGADISESRVDSIKDKVATAFVIDATDEQALSVLHLTQEIEREIGRTHKSVGGVYSDRVIDIDLLLYGVRVALSRQRFHER